MVAAEDLGSRAARAGDLTNGNIPLHKEGSVAPI